MLAEGLVPWYPVSEVKDNFSKSPVAACEDGFLVCESGTGGANFYAAKSINFAFQEIKFSGDGFPRFHRYPLERGMGFWHHG